ncbi:MAG TPA: hypothetical protein VHU88_14840 [Sporichthyaceae bacterium]|jgi:hypothetical protein|nr:hypothetical protein [Sporichthyaceae bacterium]
MLSTLIGALGLTNLVGTVLGAVLPGIGSAVEQIGGVVFNVGASLSTIVLELLTARL